MRLYWGAYPFNANACEIRALSETFRADNGRPLKIKQTLEVAGFLEADGQAAITLAMNGLITALAQPYKDLVFLKDDGSASATGLYNAGSLGGVVITRGPEFKENNGGEYNQFRKFEFTAEAEYPVAGTQNLLISFTERLEFKGGGPIYAHKLAVNGPPQKQLLYSRSIFSVMQTGEAVGFRRYPLPPGAIWPTALKDDPEFQRTTPNFRGSQYDTYKLSWIYRYESATPLIGAPHLWK